MGHLPEKMEENNIISIKNDQISMYVCIYVHISEYLLFDKKKIKIYISNNLRDY